MADAFVYAKITGIASESSYPYLAVVEHKDSFFKSCFDFLILSEFLFDSTSNKHVINHLLMLHSILDMSMLPVTKLHSLVQLQPLVQYR